MPSLYLLKLPLCLALCISVSLTLSAQSKHDFNWLLGTPSTHPELFFGGNHIDFNNGSLAVEYFSIPCDMWCPAIASGEQGELLFYSNGCAIYNKHHEVMDNGDNLNEGWLQDYACNQLNIGYPGYHSQIVLPWPGRPSEYALFHMRVSDQYVTTDLLYTHIDMSANDGFGKVLEKNQVLLQDTFSRSLAATRHANGRDWWLLAARDTASTYYAFRFGPAGIEGPFAQQPEAGWIAGHAISLMGAFSPDGSQYVRVGGDYPAAFRLYGFDRCTGTLSAPRTVPIPDTAAYAPWAYFSPNSRYLYLQNGGERLYQYDTWADDVGASAQLVGTYDGYLTIYDLPASFNSMAVGPDRRIYMSCGNGANLLHTIHRPDEPGLACDFRQHDLVLPAHILFFLPNFPNYRLYGSPGSGCDTLGGQPPMVAFWRGEQATAAGPNVFSFTDLSYFQPVSWHWDFGDGATSGEPSPLHEYPAPGIYEVCLTVCNGQGLCDTLCRPVEVLAVGTTTPTQQPQAGIKVWPNPATGAVRLSGGSDWERVRVHTAAGALVRAFGGVTEGEDLTFDVGGWPAGVYFVSAMSRAHGVLAARLVVQRE